MLARTPPAAAVVNVRDSRSGLGETWSEMKQLEMSADIAADRAAIDAEVQGRTLPDAFAATVERLGDEDALRWREAETLRARTWRQYLRAVAEVSLGLVSLGFRPGDFSLVWSRNRPEPHVADL